MCCCQQIGNASNSSACSGSVSSNITSPARSLSPLQLRVRIPDAQTLIPGECFLFLLSSLGVPSVGLYTRVPAEEEIATSAYDYPPVAPATLPPLQPGGGGCGTNCGGDPVTPPGEEEPSGTFTVTNVLILSILSIAGIGFCIGLAIWFYRQQREPSEGGYQPAAAAELLELGDVAAVGRSRQHSHEAMA